MQEDGPLSLGFGRRRASSSRACCATHGVEWVGGDALGRFEGDGRVQRVVTESGRCWRPTWW